MYCSVNSEVHNVCVCTQTYINIVCVHRNQLSALIISGQGLLKGETDSHYAMLISMST